MGLLIELLRENTENLTELVMSAEDMARLRKKYYDEPDMLDGADFGGNVTAEPYEPISPHGAAAGGDSAPVAPAGAPRGQVSQVPQPAPQQGQYPGRLAVRGMVPHQTAMSDMTGTSFAQKAPAIMQNLMRDFNLTPVQAAGVLGNLGEESGGFKQMQELHPLAGQGGLGWAQWTGSRRTQFVNWANANHLDVNSDAANYGFLKHELETTYAKVIPQLQQQTTVDGSMRTFERGYEGAGIPHYDVRNTFANQAFDLYNKGNTGGPSQTSTAQNQVNPQSGTPATSAEMQHPGGNNYMAIGDSLAYGVGGTLGNTKYAVSGYNPERVYGLVQNAIKNGDVKGKDIVLSGGASNAGGNTDMVRDYYQKQISALKAAGANSVNVMGVGPYSHFGNYGYDKIIGDISHDQGANYTGNLANFAPFHGTSVQQQVHPTSYAGIVPYIQKTFGNQDIAQAGQTPSAPSTPPTPGTPPPTQTAQNQPGPDQTGQNQAPIPVLSANSTTTAPPQTPAPDQPPPATPTPPPEQKPITTASNDTGRLPTPESYVRPAAMLLRPVNIQSYLEDL